jgi:hypothetical protein
MKKQLFRFLLVPALVCAILGVGFLSTTGLAHAATLQVPATSVQTVYPAYNPGKNCTYGYAEADDISDDVICFGINGSYTGDEFSDIYILNTGSHTVTWNWIDCNGNEHHSSKPSHTIVTASNSPGGFAGYSYMCEIFDIVLS